MSFMAKLQFGSDNAEFKDLRSSMISLFTALYMDFDAELWFAGDFSRLIFMVSYVVLVGAPISCINTLCRRLVCYRCGTKIGWMLIMIPVPAAVQHTVMTLSVGPVLYNVMTMARRVCWMGHGPGGGLLHSI